MIFYVIKIEVFVNATEQVPPFIIVDLFLGILYSIAHMVGVINGGYDTSDRNHSTESSSLCYELVCFKACLTFCNPNIFRRNDLPMHIHIHVSDI